MPQVSVIVPVYNVEDIVGRCINSILSQTFRDLELILVDDGSRDGSLEICCNWARLDARVRVISQQNGGVSCARNRGLAEACGKYIQFVDSDDYIAPNMTEKLLTAMRFYKREAVVCSCIQLIQNKNGRSNKIFLGLSDKKSELVFDHHQLWRNMLPLVWNTSSMEGPCNKLYTRRIIEEQHLTFPQDLSLGEDFLFNLEYYKYCNGLVFLSEPLYFYRVIEESKSLTNRARPSFLQEICRIECALQNHVAEHHELSKNERQILADHFSARLCAGFLHLSKKCSEDAAKKQIAEVLQIDGVQQAFAIMGGAFPQYAAFPALVHRCDVGRIVEECRRITYPEPLPPPPPTPGFANRALTKTMRGLQHFPIAPVQKWARIVELNLMTMGLKTTIFRIIHKIAH